MWNEKQICIEAQNARVLGVKQDITLPWYRITEPHVTIPRTGHWNLFQRSAVHFLSSLMLGETKCGRFRITSLPPPFPELLVPSTSYCMEHGFGQFGSPALVLSHSACLLVCGAGGKESKPSHSTNPDQQQPKLTRVPSALL